MSNNDLLLSARASAGEPPTPSTSFRKKGCQKAGVEERIPGSAHQWRRSTQLMNFPPLNHQHGKQGRIRIVNCMEPCRVPYNQLHAEIQKC